MNPHKYILFKEIVDSGGCNILNIKGLSLVSGLSEREVTQFDKFKKDWAKYKKENKIGDE